MIYRLSHIYKVKNKDQYRSASPYYYHIKEEDGRDYLFTESALRKARTRALENIEDIPNKTFVGDESSKWFAYGVALGAVASAIGAAIIFMVQ